jgi:hypothetical protein
MIQNHSRMKVPTFRSLSFRLHDFPTLRGQMEAKNTVVKGASAGTAAEEVKAFGRRMLHYCVSIDFSRVHPV